jgi:hypothetical protein
MAMYRLSFGASGEAPLAQGALLQVALAKLPTISGGGYANGTAAERTQYDVFVRAFGTHYVEAADFGAHCEFNTTLDQSYAMTKNSSFVEEQIAISIGITMKGIGIKVDIGFDFIKSEMKQDAEFEKHAQSAKTCSGGNTMLIDGDNPDYDAWVQSVYTSPAWINGTAKLRPLSELLVGENAASKRDSLKQAIAAYMER